MKIVKNETVYDARMVRALLNANAKSLSPERLKWFSTLRVELEYSKVRNGIRWDFKPGKPVTFFLRLPKPAITDQEVAKDVADQLCNGLPRREPPRTAVLSAELHTALRSSSGRQSGVIFAPNSRDLRLAKRLGEWLRIRPSKPEQQRTTQDVQRERLAHVLELERKWLRRQKLVSTKLRKLRRTRKYYERQLGA